MLIGVSSDPAILLATATAAAPVGDEPRVLVPMPVAEPDEATCPTDVPD